MALLLLSSCARPLTCTTVAVLRVVNTSLPVRALCTSVSSRVTLTPAATTRPVEHSLTSSCRALCCPESVVSARQSCRRYNTPAQSDDTPANTPVHSDNTPMQLFDNTPNNTPAQCDSAPDNNTPVQSDDTPENTPVQSDNTSVQSDNTSVQFDNNTPDNTPVQWDATPDNTPVQSDNAPVQFDNTSVQFDNNTPDNTPVQWDATTPVAAEDGVEQDFHPARPMEPCFSLAPYLPRSQVLQNLVGMGVDLSAVEKVRGAADHLVQADWSADILPRLLFLRDVGVQDSQLGPVLSKNPLLLKEGLEDMQERVSYLESKKFSQEQIVRIVTSAPLTLLLPIKYVDRKLGFLQTSFHLTGDEVRLVAAKLPKLIPWKLQKLKDIRFYMKEMLGFSAREMKAMLLVTPRVYLSDRHQLGKRFDLLHNAMGLSHRQLVAWPAVFRTRLHVVDQRHRFLLLLGCAQYDAARENYVSLRALVSGTDQHFCLHVAKAPADQFHSFLKSL